MSSTRAWARGRHRDDVPALGVAVTVILMVTAMVVPRLSGWEVNARDFPPLNSQWHPRVGPGTVPSVAIALLAVLYAGKVSAAASWPRLLGSCFVSGLAWLTSLATVDGWHGIGDILNSDFEYLPTARSIDDVSATLHQFVDRIPLGSPDNWTTHVAGHPPGALLFFVVLVRLGLGSGLAAGFTVLVFAATTPVAVMMTLRTLGAESAARRVAPFLVFGPAAIWSAVSADAMFGAVAAWGLSALALAAVSTTRASTAVWAVVSGVLLGYCVMMSYGLALLGFLAVAVLVAARTVRPLPWAAASASAVVLGFAIAGFTWWEGLAVLRVRYYGGIAGVRPAGYWVWGDLAALGFSAGPLVGGAVAAAVHLSKRVWTATAEAADRSVALLTGAALLCIVVADLSFMSKAETERIWLPFVPWLLVGCSLLPASWLRRGLAVQVGVALTVQTLLYTRW